ncbi:MAG: hypothetical protein KAX65_00175 [Caldilineaceae bacterium]|nr:hypothetical protein [Caldilineaceae bacterium]
MISDASAPTPYEGQPDAPTSTDTRTADQLLSDAASATGTPGTADKPASTNLHDDPNFRKLQSSYEKRLAEQAKRLAELEAAQEEATLADMDDVDRLKYERDKFARQLEERTQAETIQQQKQQILSELSAKSGVPVEALAEAESAYDAALLAVDYLKRGGAERREASKVDLGGGRANTPADRIETAAREAFANRDASAYIRLLREAQD